MELDYPVFILTEEEQDLFDELAETLIDNGVSLQPQDATTLGMLVTSTIDYRDARQNLAEQGTTIEVTSDRGHTTSRINPAVDIAKKAETAIKNYSTLLHMNPNARKDETKSPTTVSVTGDNVLDYITKAGV